MAWFIGRRLTCGEGFAPAIQNPGQPSEILALTLPLL